LVFIVRILIVCEVQKPKVHDLFGSNQVCGDYLGGRTTNIAVCSLQLL